MSEIRDVMELIDRLHPETEAREELRCAIIEYGKARWEPIERGLPSRDGIEVLVRPTEDPGWGPKVFYATWNEKDQSFDCEGGWFEIDEVSHWMRIHD